MLTYLLYLLASLGTIVMGLRYVLATPPLDYHAGITRDDTLGKATLAVLGALYKVLGSGYVGVGLMALLLTLFANVQEHMILRVAILAGTLAAGGGATVIPYRMEKKSGVKTPWRMAGGITALMLLAFVVSLFEV